MQEKEQWIHAEGVAQSVYALTEAQIWDENTWKLLKEKIASTDFDCLVVKNDRWNI